MPPQWCLLLLTTLQWNVFVFVDSWWASKFNLSLQVPLIEDEFHVLQPKFLWSAVYRFSYNELWAITIKGSAFLWHQVRCMVAVLFMIGQGFESPNVSTWNLIRFSSYGSQQVAIPQANNLSHTTFWVYLLIEWRKV